MASVASAAAPASVCPATAGLALSSIPPAPGCWINLASGPHVPYLQLAPQLMKPAVVESP
eukprot:4904494-Karenia_brevis.AAC.1